MRVPRQASNNVEKKQTQHYLQLGHSNDNTDNKDSSENGILLSCIVPLLGMGLKVGNDAAFNMAARNDG